jgi:hypothetical protein
MQNAYILLIFFFTLTFKKADPSSKDKNIYKRKNPSFTQEYFEKSINDKGDEMKICKILDESGRRCGQEYKNVGSSMGNLIAHLRDKHGIVAQDDTIVSKKV